MSGYLKYSTLGTLGERLTIMVLTEHTVTVLWETLTGLSRLHSEGALWVTESAIARESGYTEYDTHIMLADAEGLGWVTRRGTDPVYRLNDGVVTPILRLKYCDVCKIVSGETVRAIADARVSSGRWGNLCAEHFLAGGCRLGLGFGQFLRMEY